MTSHLPWGEGGLWPRDFPSSFVLASGAAIDAGGSHVKGCGAKGCGMDKTRKGRTSQVIIIQFLVVLMTKVVEPKVVEWTRLGRKEIVPDKKKAFLMYIFCFPQNIHVIYRSDITFVLGWGWAVAQRFPFKFCPCKWLWRWFWCYSWQRLFLQRLWDGHD